ncbi:unnamed protein product [Vitrella brassicaformis CCMP3155]|uniref:RRM domain-containing protein n=1 Tax=Vitrella brassicaformis (strain CCMP3155) TaxID=1169540 RepID=A0A0G4EW54_VITBC|nr:unnamed protein product [Vitrella brassicaformis CCMP3155]|eukprot:CEM03177.1 unnamed protein product [Vitrella brassicaformis CCMP3155]
MTAQKRQGVGLNAPPGRVLLIRNLPRDVSELEIKEAFSPFTMGQELRMFHVPSAGQALVEFPDGPAASAALAQVRQGGVVIRGCTIQGSYSTPESVETNQERSADCRILLVTVTNLQYAVEIDALERIFSRYGFVDKIVLFGRVPGMAQAWIQFQSCTDAAQALTQVNGRNMYDGCNTLQVQLSDMTELWMKDNRNKGRDFTKQLPTAQPAHAVPIAGVAGSPTARGDVASMPPPMYMSPFGAEKRRRVDISHPSAAAAGGGGHSGGGSIGAGGAAAATQQQHEGGGSSLSAGLTTPNQQPNQQQHPLEYIFVGRRTFFLLSLDDILRLRETCSWAGGLSCGSDSAIPSANRQGCTGWCMGGKCSYCGSMTTSLAYLPPCRWWRAIKDEPGFRLDVDPPLPPNHPYQQHRQPHDPPVRSNIDYLSPGGWLDRSVFPWDYSSVSSCVKKIVLDHFRETHQTNRTSRFIDRRDDNNRLHTLMTQSPPTAVGKCTTTPSFRFHLFGQFARRLILTDAGHPFVAWITLENYTDNVYVRIHTTESAVAGVGGAFRDRFPQTTRLAHAVLGAIIAAELLDQ